MSILWQKWGALIALLFPVAGLGAAWAVSHVRAQQGEEWLIPVEGYDPRDLLRGHYIQYRYDWPVEKSADPDMANSTFYGQDLCIEGRAPNMVRARVYQAGDKDCAIVARASMGTRQEVQGLDSGILYVAQTAARGLEDKLRDPKLQGMIRVKIREDGVMRPVAMEFRARPVATRPQEESETR